MKVDGDWRRDPRAQRVMAMLNDAGHQAYFVGGCVRNAALGAPVDDVDITTDAAPLVVTELAERAGLKPVPTGISHGTVTVVADGRPFEVTTFRRDTHTDGRRAKVAFSGTMTDDAARRDFTMNALYADADGTVHDPLGGLRDLLDRRVRFVGDPDARIAEDYLRILRYFRFHAWYGDTDMGVDADALAACAAGADGLERLSAERVGSEILKLLAAPDPAPSVASMAQAGILARILPGADASGLAPLVHLEGLTNVPADAVRRLAIIGGEDPTERLRLSKRQAARLTLLGRGMTGTEGTAELAWRHGPDVARDIELLRATNFGAPLPANLEARISLGTSASFPVRGADLKAQYAGAEIGKALRDLEARWIASDFTLTRDDLLG